MGHILLLRCRLCFRSEDKKTCHIKNSKTQGLTKEIVKIYMTIFKSNMPIVTECGVSIIPRLATHLQDYGIYDLELIHQTFALFNNTNKATQLAVADVLKSLLYNMVIILFYVIVVLLHNHPAINERNFRVRVGSCFLLVVYVSLDFYAVSSKNYFRNCMRNKIPDPSSDQRCFIS